MAAVHVDGATFNESKRMSQPGLAALPRLSRISRSLLLLMAAVSGACWPALPCRAQSFALTLDVEQGLQFGMDRPRTPYLFGARFAPALELDRARVGLVVGPAYRNPDWDFAVGGQLSLFFPFSVRDLGVRLAAQGEYLPVHRSARLSMGFLAEAFGLLRLGVWPGYDFELQRAELTVSIGVDLMSWNRLLAGSQETSFDPR